MFEKEGRFVWPGCTRRVEIGSEYVNTIRDETQVLCWLEAKIGRVFKMDETLKAHQCMEDNAA